MGPRTGQQLSNGRLHPAVIRSNNRARRIEQEEFRNFPFLDNDNIIANLARELPDYLAAADGVVMANEEEKLAWWAAHSDTLPHWAGVVKKLLVIQPSSASAERVFSLLKNAFNDQQDNALEDYLEASVMIRYNNAKRL